MNNEIQKNERGFNPLNIIVIGSGVLVGLIGSCILKYGFLKGPIIAFLLILYALTKTFPYLIAGIYYLIITILIIAGISLVISSPIWLLFLWKKIIKKIIKIFKQNKTKVDKNSYYYRIFGKQK